MTDNEKRTSLLRLKIHYNGVKFQGLIEDRIHLANPFSALLMLQSNKLEHFSLPNLSRLVWPNIKLARRNLPRTNTIAYFAAAKLRENKKK